MFCSLVNTLKMEIKNIDDIVRNGWDKIKQKRAEIGLGTACALLILGTSMLGYGAYKMAVHDNTGKYDVAISALIIVDSAVVAGYWYQPNRHENDLQTQ